MVYVSTKTPYMTLFKDFLAKKHRLAIDAWGADDSQVRHVYQPLIDLVRDEIPEKYRQLYPTLWKYEDRVGRLARSILISEFMIKEWADHLVGKSKEELESIAASFKLEGCMKRDGLNRILMENAKLVA
jgi:hypothetical protein